MPTPVHANPAEPTWHRFSAADTTAPDADSVLYGAAVPPEPEVRLLGPVEQKRILDLGCGAGHNAVALARQGAKVLAVDPDADMIASARSRAEAAEVRVELHQAELAEIPFLRSDSIDAAISVMALASVDDLARVFRQVHRVLRTEAALVASFPHPAFTMFDPTAEDPLRAVRAYDDATPIRTTLAERDLVDRPRTFSELFTTLHRAGFRVDQVLEPTAPASGPRGPGHAELMRSVPPTLVLRARKQGN